MQASLKLGNEIEHASKWPGPLTWSETTLHQRARSMKLFATVKSTFATMRFSEGISLASSNVDMNSDQHVTRVAVEKHTTDQCTADVSKIKCFKCHKHGHIQELSGAVERFCLIQVPLPLS